MASLLTIQSLYDTAWKAFGPEYLITLAADDIGN